LENAVNRARLMRSGFTDVLTGWHNRRYLQVRLTEELARARRDQSSLVCLMLDLDHFKLVNDTYGHAAGDEVLRELAHRVELQVRASDVAARYGGEEFVVLMPHTDVRSGQLLAERIRQAVSATPVVFDDDREVAITASIGIAVALPGKDEKDLKTLGDSLIARADVALYRAKAAGRNRIEIATA
jgi:diguanylate cyclase (GGDEF)-like protein